MRLRSLYRIRGRPARAEAREKTRETKQRKSACEKSACVVIGRILEDSNDATSRKFGRVLIQGRVKSLRATQDPDPFDFFCIVIWKANRAKSRVAERLMTHNGGQVDLGAAVSSLLTAISEASDRKERLSVLTSVLLSALPSDYSKLITEVPVHLTLPPTKHMLIETRA